MNLVVEYIVSVISSTIAHEGICTTDVVVRLPEKVITVDRTVTQTSFYLSDTTTTIMTSTVINVTSSHACTQSVPPKGIFDPKPTPGGPAIMPDPGPVVIKPNPGSDGGDTREPDTGGIPSSDRNQDTPDHKDDLFQ